MEIQRYLILGFITAGVSLTRPADANFVDLGTLYAPVGTSANLQYISESFRPIQHCQWSRELNDTSTSEYPKFKRNLSDESNGKCGFTIHNITKQHDSLWRFIVIFKESLIEDKSDLLLKGKLNLDVVEQEDDHQPKLKILSVDGTLFLVDSSNDSMQNSTGASITCCADSKLFPEQQQHPHFQFDNTTFSGSAVKHFTLADKICTAWKSDFDWRDDGKKITCQAEFMNSRNGSTTVLQDSVKLRILYGPRALPDSNTKMRNLTIKYPAQQEISVKFMSNTEPILTWTVAISKAKHESLSDLDEKYQTELRHVDNQFEAILSIRNISNPTSRQTLERVKLKLSNMYDDWHIVYFHIHFSKHKPPELPPGTDVILSLNQSFGAKTTDAAFSPSNSPAFGFNSSPEEYPSTEKILKSTIRPYFPNTSITPVFNSNPNRSTEVYPNLDPDADSSFHYIYVIFAISVIVVLAIIVIYTFRKASRNTEVFGRRKMFLGKIRESDLNLTKSTVEVK